MVIIIIIIIVIIIIIYALNTMKRHHVYVGIALKEIFDRWAAHANHQGKLVCGFIIGGVYCREGRFRTGLSVCTYYRVSNLSINVVSGFKFTMVLA